MELEQERLLAAVIAAHENHRVVGRTRLQKTIKLLQRLGLPTDYGYMNFFYGPYSEAVQADIRLLEHMGLVREAPHTGRDNQSYYIFEAAPTATLSEVEPWQNAIDRMSRADPVVLELAATYDAFREMGSNHDEALARLRHKKGPKCDGGNLQAALGLLVDLGLPAS
jgi:uncharacterized protein